MNLIDKDAIPWTVEGVGEIPVVTKEEIDEMPTIDAVPVVRCKDCKYKYTDGDNVVANYCLLNHNRVQPDEWFCADAERKEE